MINRLYIIPRVGEGTEEDPYKAEWEPTEIGESCELVEEDGDNWICRCISSSVLPYPSPT